MDTPPAEADAHAYDALAAELTDRFDAWSRASLADERWKETLLDDLARRAFEVQFAGNVPYRRYCERRGVDPSLVAGWRDVPPVPTAAFRVVDLIVGSRRDAAVVFRTSGTSGGPSRRGRHLVRSPALYRASLEATFGAYVASRETEAKMVTLSPSFAYDPHSSLGWMLDHLRGAFGAGDGETVASDSGIDWRRLDDVVMQSHRSGRPLCLLGTTLSFAWWLERTKVRGLALELPPGTRLMDTGGMKARSDRSRDEVALELADVLSVGADAVVNEFGMTELLSQRYGAGVPARPLAGPPWLRTRVLDPISLTEVPAGEVGILCHYDLANLGSVCAVLTEDRGRAVGRGIEWLGRTPGAPPRGCSLATAELLAAQADA